MRRTILCAAMVFSCAVTAFAQNASIADGAFMKALESGDKAKIAPLLDPDLVWTDSAGKTLNRSEVLENLPPSPTKAAAAKSHTYGNVVTIRTDDGKMHVLRVWAKRPSDWKLLVYHEVKQADQPAGGPPAPPVKECVNPCKSVPYSPKNDAEAGVIKSWQALETAVTAGDSKIWATHFADEFVVIGSGGTDPVTKQGRMDALDRQKAAGTNGAPAGLAPGRTKMFTVGDTVVMNCEAIPHRGKPAHITRVWIKKNGEWLMTVSFQTTIQAAQPVGNHD